MPFDKVTDMKVRKKLPEKNKSKIKKNGNEKWKYNCIPNFSIFLLLECITFIL